VKVVVKVDGDIEVKILTRYGCEDERKILI
jgi:hypothetical protein